MSALTMLTGQPSTADALRPAPAPRGTERSDATGFADTFASARLADRRSDRTAPTESNAPSRSDQRARVESHMLSGAMKYAARRQGSPRSLPDAPPTTPKATNEPITGDSRVIAAPADLPMDAQVVSPEFTVIGMPETDAIPAELFPDSALAAPLSAAPARNTDDRISLDEALLAAGGDDAAATPVAGAAMQLLAALPLLVVPQPVPATPVADALDPATETEVDDATFDDATGSTRALTPLSAAATGAATSTVSQAAAQALVEDHFDVPAAAVRGGSRSDASAVQKEVAKLAPEFRDRLERVMERMKKEYGHSVTVVETVRSQARQEALYAQGRTAPGPVVTWTRHSKHATGLAADLMVDGQWDNPKGYAHLATIASQEGLRTLGARDPGHVELPGQGGDQAVSDETLGALLSDLQGDAGNGARQMRAELTQQAAVESNAAMLTRVANVAQVARVAQVAEVARVAQVAKPGASKAESNAGAESAPFSAFTAPSPQTFTTDTTAALRVATPVTGVNLSDRISTLLDLQAAQNARPLSSVMLRMQNATGIDDQIRIDTRGTSVDAQLGLGNAAQAAAVTERLGELREALERRGLSADAVRVNPSAPARTSDAIGMTRAAAPAIELAAMRAASDSQFTGSGRDQSSRNQDEQREAFARQQASHTPRSSSDDARHRSRREQPEERR